MESVPIRRTSSTGFNAQASMNGLSTNIISPLPPTTSSTNSAFFPTVFEEEAESFSEASSENDEVNDDLGKFVEDIELWSPSTDDIGMPVVTIHEQSFNTISCRNKKPRRQLPVITPAVTNTSTTSRCKVENGSCSIDSGISRLLSSVDKAVSCVANKAIKKNEHNQTSFCEKEDKKSMLPASTILSFAHSLTPAQSPPISSPIEIAAKSPSSCGNNLDVNHIWHNCPVSTIPKIKATGRLSNSRRYSDYGPNEGFSGIKDNHKTLTNDISSTLNIRANSSIPSSPVRPRPFRNDNSNISSTTLENGSSICIMQSENSENDRNLLLETRAAKTSSNFASPPLSPSITYCNSISSLSPKLARIGRRMLPEPPRMKSKKVLKETSNTIESNQKSTQISVEEQRARQPSVDFQARSVSNGAGILSCSNDTSRPTIIQQFYSHVITSSEDPQDRACLSINNIPTGSITTTPHSVAAGSTWHSVSSRDSLDSGFFSTGHSRSTTCDSTSSNVSGGSYISTSKGNLQEVSQNDSSPNSSANFKSVPSNESPPLFRRQCKLMSSYGLRLNERQEFTSETQKKESYRTKFLNTPEYDEGSTFHSSPNSILSNINSKADLEMKQSTYNRVQSLPSQNSSEHLVKDCMPTQLNQQSLPSNTYISLSSELYPTIQSSINESHPESSLSNSSSDTFGLRVHFNSFESRSAHLNDLEYKPNDNYDENNQRNLGAHDVLCSSTCDNNILCCNSNHVQKFWPPDRNNQIDVETKMCNQSCFTSSKETSLATHSIISSNQDFNQKYTQLNDTNAIHIVENSISCDDTLHQRPRTCKSDSFINQHTRHLTPVPNFSKYSEVSSGISEPDKINQCSKNDSVTDEDETELTFKQKYKSPRLEEKENTGKNCYLTTESHLCKSELKSCKHLIFPRSREDKIYSKNELKTTAYLKYKNRSIFGAKENDLKFPENHSPDRSLQINYEERNLTIEGKPENDILYYEPFDCRNKLHQNYEEIVSLELKPKDSGRNENYPSATIRRHQWSSVQKYNSSGYVNIDTLTNHISNI